MSAEAMQLVIHHTSARGAGYTALLMIADASKDRGNKWPRASISIPALAVKCRCNERSMVYTLRKLIAAGKLSVIEEPRGQTPAVYEIPVRGLQKTKGLGLQEVAPLIREEPRSARLAGADCTKAEGVTSVLPSEPSNVVPMYPAKKRRKA